MIHNIEILESQFTFNDNDCILLTDENKDIIGRKLEEQGYTWASGENIIQNHRFKSGRLLHIYEYNKNIKWSEVFNDKKILNYKFIKIDL